jgi:hypothetical protein
MKDIVIHCVFDGQKGTGNFNEMGEFCLKQGIPCVIRPFSHKYEEDKEEITRLPAYHIYYKKEYVFTFYKGDCPEAAVKEIQYESSWSWPLLGKAHLL